MVPRLRRRREGRTCVRFKKDLDTRYPDGYRILSDARWRSFRAEDRRDSLREKLGTTEFV